MNSKKIPSILLYYANRLYSCETPLAYLPVYHSLNAKDAGKPSKHIPVLATRSNL